MWAKAEYEVTREAFENRIERVRRFAVDSKLAAVVAFSPPRICQWSQTGHVGYLTNWSNLDRNTDTMVVVPSQGEAVLLVAGVVYMLDQIAEVSWIEDVRLVKSPDPRAISGAYDHEIADQADAGGVRSFGEEVRSILEQFGVAGDPIGISGMEAITHLIYRDLERNAPGGISPIADIVADLRSVKEPAEVEILRQAAATCDSAYRAMLETLREGMWGYELTAAMDHAARSLGADLSYHCMHSTPGDDIAAGKLDLKTHDRRLGRGDYINVNSYVVYKGYWVQGDRVGTIGDVMGASARKLADANLQIQDEVLGTIRPGLSVAEMVDGANASAARLGYPLPGGRIGHGQGLDYAEQPFLIGGNEAILEPGNVFVLHICMGVLDTNIMLNPIADLCHVTESGVEVLTKFPRELFHAAG